MERSILAARRAWAIEDIQKKSGIDLSREALRKAPSVEIFQLFQLEKVARELGSVNEEKIIAELLAKIENISGVGSSTMEKIKKELER